VSIHGTPGGYQGHLRRREPPCEACRHANSLATQRWRDRQHPKAAAARVPLTLLADLLDLLPVEARAWAVAVLGDAAPRAVAIKDLINRNGEKGTSHH
jgi:hypothetical protein